MISEEPSRLGIHHLLPNGHFSDRGERGARFALKIKFHRLFQIRDGFLTRGAEAGYLHVETLGNDEFLLPVEHVRDCLHEVKLPCSLVVGNLGKGATTKRHSPDMITSLPSRIA